MTGFSLLPVLLNCLLQEVSWPWEEETEKRESNQLVAVEEILVRGGIKVFQIPDHSLSPWYAGVLINSLPS